jgi:hypothetical protein
MKSIISKMSIIILSLMASTFAFAQDISDPRPDSTPTSIDGDAMAPDQSSKNYEGLPNAPSEDPQAESEGTGMPGGGQCAVENTRRAEEECVRRVESKNKTTD